MFIFKAIGRMITPRLSKATRLRDQGDAASESKNYPKAIECYEKSLAILTKLNDCEQSIAYIYSSLGIVYMEQSEYRKGQEYCRAALSINLKLLGPNDITVAENYAILGAIYRHLKKYRKSIEYLNMALAICLKRPELLPGVISCYSALANVYELHGKRHEAIENANKVLQIQKSGQRVPAYRIRHAKNIIKKCENFLLHPPAKKLKEGEAAISRVKQAGETGESSPTSSHMVI
jgi:tetratricopeptide (TPR) repeat protein